MKTNKNILIELEQAQQQLFATIYRIDRNTTQIEELSYSTQCWNADESKNQIKELIETNYRLEEENFILQEKINTLKQEVINLQQLQEAYQLLNKTLLN